MADKFVSKYTSDEIEGILDKANNLQNYSTEEQIIGSWIDGKPIYQKTIECGALSNSSNNVNKFIDTGINGIDTVIDIKSIGYFFAQSGDNGYMNTLFWKADSSSEYIYTYVGDNTNNGYPNKIAIQYKGNIAWLSNMYVTIQYTKTTD